MWALIGFALAFAAAGLGVMVTQGQNTWVPSNHWLAPLLFGIAMLLLLCGLIKARWSRRSILRAARDGVVRNPALEQETHGTRSPAINIGSGTVTLATLLAPLVRPLKLQGLQRCQERRTQNAKPDGRGLSLFLNGCTSLKCCRADAWQRLWLSETSLE